MAGFLARTNLQDDTYHHSMQRQTGIFDKVDIRLVSVHVEHVALLTSSQEVGVETYHVRTPLQYSEATI